MTSALGMMRRPGTLMRWRRLQPVLRELVAPGAFVLDIGGFDGLVGHFVVATCGAHYHGVDIDREGLASLVTGGLSGTCASGLALPLPDASADVVLLLDVIEHVEDHELLLAEARRVLKPEGRMLLTTPNAAVRIVPWADMAAVHRLWDHQLRPGYHYEAITGLLARSGFCVETYTTAFNIVTRWSYYMHFVQPGARRLLAALGGGVFDLTTRLEPWLPVGGLTHVFVLRRA